MTEIQALTMGAITVACLHTAAGPDHYLPFIALARARGWTRSRMLFWTMICGSGHVLSSVVLGLALMGAGWSLSRITHLEEVRGGLAGWSLLSFGFIYLTWSFVRLFRDQAHKHFEVYDDGSIFVYRHDHNQEPTPDRYTVTPWVMFIIFVLGPCEPMIPLIAFPAAKESWIGMTVLVVVYTFFTLATMTFMVLLGYHGISIFNTARLEKFAPALGGFTILICGAGMVFLNW